MQHTASYIDATITLTWGLGLQRAVAFVHPTVTDPRSSFQDAGLECRSFRLPANASAETAIRDWAGHLAHGESSIDVLYLDGWPVGFANYKELHREVLDGSKHLLSPTAILCVGGSAMDHGGKAQLVVPLAEQLGFALLASDDCTLLVRVELQASVDEVPLPVPRFATLTFADALAFHRRGLTWQAQRLYQRLLQQEPSHAQALHMLGLTYHQEGRRDLAREFLQRATTLLPSDALVWNNLGVAELADHQAEQARHCFQRASELKPDYPDAWNNLANVEFALGNASMAERVLGQGLTHRPGDVPTLQRLYRALASRGEFQEALTLLGRAVAAEPQNRSLRLELATLSMQANQLLIAAREFQQLIEKPPVSVTIRLNYAKVLAEIDRTDEAHHELELACRSSAAKPAWRLRQDLLCPSVLPSVAAVDEYRQRLSERLDRWLADTPAIPLQDLLHLDCYPPFALSFQGREHRPLKEKFAQLFRRWVTPLAPDPKPGKKRIGFVVTRGHEPVFLRCTAAIVDGLSAFDLQAVVLCAASGEAQLRKGLRDSVMEFHSFPDDVATAAEVIARAGCHLLYYWEVGSDALNYLLPFHCLAPVQVTSWGTQVTSGLAEMDHYLSSELIETPEAQQHYTENLVRLATLPTYQSRVVMPEGGSREVFGLPTDRPIYLCPQTLLKLHPEQDQLFAMVLREDPQGILVLKEGRYPAATQKLQQRLQCSLGSDYRRVMWIAWQSHADYLRLLQQADVVLDTLYFSGGTTAYDIFSANQLIVTLPGQWNIGRYVNACYQKIAFGDLIAKSAEEYVRLAVGVAHDGARRAALRCKLEERAGRLFEEKTAIQEHASIFTKLSE